jgi:hypothetical protein
MDHDENFIEILRDLDRSISEADNPKNESYPNRVKTIYDYVADLAGLVHKSGNVYSLKNTGKLFVRTKFGFQPAEVFNKGLELQRLLVVHEELQVQYKQLKVTLEKTIISINETKASKIRTFISLTKKTKEVDELNKKLEHHVANMNEITELKKEMTMQLKILSEKNSSLIFENQNLKKSEKIQVSGTQKKYDEFKITKLYSKDKKLQKASRKKKK